MPEMMTVEDWPLISYPWRPEWKGVREGMIYTPTFKIEFRRRDGSKDFKTWHGYVEKTDEDTGDVSKVEVNVPYQGKSWLISRPCNGVLLPKNHEDEDDPHYVGWMSLMPPVDLRRAEMEIGGQPTDVMAALRARWDGNQWVPDDLEKIHIARYWVDVSDKYFNVMRPRAYENVYDPFKGQKRPWTKVKELEKTIRDSADLKVRSELEKKNADLQAELARLKAGGK